MKIDKIEPSAHVKGRVLVTLEDGRMLKVTEQELLTFSLRVGKDLNREEQKALELAAGRSQTRVQAARLVGKRPYSRKELQDKLQGKGCSEPDVEETLTWLEDIGALDEESYGRMLVRRYSGMGYGPAKCKDELFRHGIPRERWDEILQELPDQQELILAYLDKKWNGRELGEEDVRKLSAALQRRGFSWEDIRPCLNKFASQHVNEDEV